MIIMDEQELKQKYMELYEYMATSGNPKNMKAFGKVMTEMYDWFAVNKKEAAEEWLMKLESVRWNNYFTQTEAEKIVADMRPKAPWTKDAWKNVMQSLGLRTEDSPCYNSCAMWVAMNMVYSDHGASIAKLLGTPLPNLQANVIVPAVHSMAIDLLCDIDKKFDIRHYFGL